MLKFTNARPDMHSCLYTENHAPYGPTFASYPVRLTGRLLINETSKEENLWIQKVVTGQIITNQLVFELKDEYNQTVTVPQNEEESINKNIIILSLNC